MYYLFKIEHIKVYFNIKYRKIPLHLADITVLLEIVKFNVYYIFLYERKINVNKMRKCILNT